MKIAELKTSDMDATRAAILFETRVAPYSECLAMEDNRKCQVFCAKKIE